jgi:hypothetical protein
VISHLAVAIISLLTFSTAVAVPERQLREAPNAQVSPPIDDILSRLVRDFELFDGEYAAGHRGIDVRVAPGEVIRSPISGWIHFSGYVVDRPVISVINAEGELYSFEPACSAFVKGERVSSREIIAEVCAGSDNYSHCSQTCVHISLRVGGQYLSPLARFGLLQPSRLYPLSYLDDFNHALG